MKEPRNRAAAAREKTLPWDPADYLEDASDVVAYLEAAFEDGDPQVIAGALGDVARSKGMTAVAAKSGLGRESLYKALSRDGNPGFATVLSVLAALGLRLHPSLNAEGSAVIADGKHGMREPVHPGETLRGDLEALGMSASELARRIEVPVDRITEVLAGRRAVTGDTALRLGRFFGTSGEFWLNLQKLYDLRRAERDNGAAIARLPTLDGARDLHAAS